MNPKYLLATMALAGHTSLSFAEDNCNLAPSCRAPAYCPPPAAAATAAATPAGMFAQPAATGDVQGEATGTGVRGLAIRIPEINLQLPTIQFPSTFKYRRGPQMHVDASSAPFVTGAAANFGMLPSAAASGVPAATPAATPAGMPPWQCTPIPPCPAGASLERQKLLDELARKDAELQQMQARFGQLEDAVNRLAQQRQPAPIETSAYSVERTNYVQPAAVEAAPVKSTPVVPRASRLLSPPAPGGQKRTAAAPRPVEVAPTRAEATAGNVGYSKIVEEKSDTSGLGVWNGAGKPTTVAQRTPRK